MKSLQVTAKKDQIRRFAWFRYTYNRYAKSGNFSYDDIMRAILWSETYNYKRMRLVKRKLKLVTMWWHAW